MRGRVARTLGVVLAGFVLAAGPVLAARGVAWVAENLSTWWAAWVVLSLLVAGYVAWQTRPWREPEEGGG